MIRIRFLSSTEYRILIGRIIGNLLLLLLLYNWLVEGKYHSVPFINNYFTFVIYFLLIPFPRPWYNPRHFSDICSHRLPTLCNLQTWQCHIVATRGQVADSLWWLPLMVGLGDTWGVPRKSSFDRNETIVGKSSGHKLINGDCRLCGIIFVSDRRRYYTWSSNSADCFIVYWKSPMTLMA